MSRQIYTLQQSVYVSGIDSASEQSGLLHINVCCGENVTFFLFISRRHVIQREALIDPPVAFNVPD